MSDLVNATEWTEIELAGSHEVLLSHMSLLGTALILEEEIGAGRVLCRWGDGPNPSARLRLKGLASSEIGRIVQKHATRLADEVFGLLAAQHPDIGALFSARTKSPKSAEQWREVLDARSVVVRGLRGLGSSLSIGIGERAWWFAEHKRLRPDHGASAWEMRTRNRGMEFISDTLRPLAVAVAKRTPTEVLSGLVGRSVEDEVGKNKAESRTGTGLGPVGPTDSARAWTGLWAIAGMPVWPSPSDRSVTSAAVPRKRGRPGQLIMPMCTQWVTTSRWLVALRSSVLTDVGTAAADGDDLSVQYHSGLKQLKDWGFDLVLRFPVSVSGSSSAPERRALAGVSVR